MLLQDTEITHQGRGLLNYYSIVLKGIVDERGRFREIFVGAPGKVHDTRILRKSKFFED